MTDPDILNIPNNELPEHTVARALLDIAAQLRRIDATLTEIAGRPFDL